MNELINKLNQYRSIGDKFYPEDIVVIEDIWALIDEIERLNNIINRTTKYVESLSSSGRGCDIYDDIKQEILKELKGDVKE